MKRILITGAGGPAGINFTRSLKLVEDDELQLIGVEGNRYHRFLAETEKCYLVPKAKESGYIEKLNQIIDSEGINFVHAQPDIEVRVISENRERLKARVFLPKKRTVEICQDKFETYKVLSKAGVAVPRTIEIEKEEDVKRAFRELGSPIWIRATSGAGGRGSTPASNIETVTAWISYWRLRGLDWKFIAQEYLEGRNLAFHGLFKNGRLITSMARERLEYIYPSLAPSGITGTPSVQRTIHDELVNQTAVRAVQAIDPEYEGLACIDMKEDSEGVPHITEINPGRMFTTSYFFSYAGKKLYRELGMEVDWFANLPYIYIKLGFGEEIPRLQQFNILPVNLYWIRHMDAPAKLVWEDNTINI